MIGLLAAVALLLGSGGLALAAGRRPRLATGLGAAGALAASLVGLLPAVAVLRGGAGGEVSFAWALPFGPLRLGLDPLSAFFLVPVFILGGLCAVYGAAYMQGHAGRRRALGPQTFFFNTTQGVLHAYLSYILIVVVAALAWASARRWWGGS